MIFIAAVTQKKSWIKLHKIFSCYRECRSRISKHTLRVSYEYAYEHAYHVNTRIVDWFIIKISKWQVHGIASNLKNLKLQIGKSRILFTSW
jgi:hypothetical protein